MNAVKKIDQWENIIHSVMPDFNRIAKTHKAVRWQEECEFALQAVQKNKKLQECFPVTVQNAIKNVASVGLTLNPADSLCYLVPEYNKDLGGLECQLRISFMGLMKVAADSGAVQWVKADVVYAADEFKLRGITEEPIHHRDPFNKDRGEVVGAYCVAKLPTGEYLTEVMSRAELDKARAAAKYDAVWATWFDEMAKKSVIKRASKQWIKSDRHNQLNAAVHVINETEGSDDDYLIYTPEQEQAHADAIESGDPLKYLAFCENIADGINAEPSANSDILGALTRAYKERFREEKKMTEKGDLIKSLFAESTKIMAEDKDRVLDLLEDNDPDAIKEITDQYKEYGLGSRFWNMFSDDEQHAILELMKP